MPYTTICVIHPLIRRPVPNSAALSGPALVTGSNTSGKSTFLKTVLINAILAQSVCTALCTGYRAAAFKIFSSMAVSDNLSAGESCFIVEIKSFKHLMDSADTGGRTLCAVDEVLLGTNTVERIAASSELLRAIHEKNILCIAATHDTPLCTLLSDSFAQYHF